MPTSSFDKDFSLNTSKELESFEKILSQPPKKSGINKKLISADKIKRGEIKVKRMLSK